MAVTLKEVNIAGLKLTTGTVIPVIKCTISYTDGGFDSHEEFAAFQEALYPIVKGATITCGVWWNYRKPALKPEAIQDLAVGAHTQGDDTGFKLTYNVVTGHNVVEYVQYVTLYFKGNEVAFATPYSGYSDFETSFLVIYVTEDGKIISSIGAMIGLEMLYSFNSGVAVVDLVPVGYIADEGTVRTPSGRPYQFTESTDSIKPYITTEYNPENTDPYVPGGPAGPGGGGGTFDDQGDAIPFSTPPAISATDTGFCTLFATTISGIQSVANKLWTDLFDAIKPGGSLEGTVEALKSLVTSPYDAILGCTILPFGVATTSSKPVKLYGVLDCGVSLNVAASQWQIINCGYLDIIGTRKSYLDYAPYTKVTSLYLPYIGTVSIDVDAIMGKRVAIQYMVDILSGQCIAQVMIDNAVQAQYQGHCAVNVPVTSIDWSSTVNAGLGLIGNVANIVGSAAGGLGVSAAGLGAAAGAIAGQLPSMAQNVMSAKPDIKSGGGVGGAAGQMGAQKPILIIERPNQSIPSVGKYGQNHWTGYPSNIAAKLGSLTGYTEVARIFVNRTNATAEEKTEIERLLMEGVYF